MKVHLQFQANESLPPDLCLQLKRHLANTLASYGLTAQVSMDLEAELEAYQLFWQWNEQRRNDAKIEVAMRGLLGDDFPKTPGDAEVK